MSSEKPYIGCKIGLISKAQNRYEGVLYTIDKVNSTVVLAKVKCLGTEGRQTDRSMAPKDDVYEYITFQGSDIKDISLCERPQLHHGLPPDPAIVQSSSASLSNVSTLNLGTLRVPVYHQLPASSLLNRQHATALGLGAAIRSGATVEKAVQTIGMERYRRPWPPSQEQWERRRPQVRKRARPQARREMPWLGGPVMTRSRWYSNRKGHVGANASRPLKFDTDFDFDSSNAQFIKELEREVQDQGKDVHDEAMEKKSPREDDPLGPKCYYNKAKSFYDNISSDYKLRLTWAEERKWNLETFGVPGMFRRSMGFRYLQGIGWSTAQIVSTN